MEKPNIRQFKRQFIPRPNIEVPLYLQAPASVKELEIGSGNGEFAFYRAKSSPQSYFIAIEKTRTLFNQMYKRYQKAPLSNLWIFHTNAVWWITHFVSENSLNRVYILYPNVYIKPGQSNLRWFNRPFMPYLINCLKLGGELEIRTNEKDYYEECKLKLNQFKNIKKKQDFHLVGPSCTAFERKYRERGQVCRSLVFTRFF
ncbi:MAG: DUF938 domain-containing protein [Bdellovibrionales bacterium]|nr:DUF938 domain-containing protein [Bdellovibrionales bacterium]